MNAFGASECRASHASGVGLWGPRERACNGVRGTKSLGLEVFQ